MCHAIVSLYESLTGDNVDKSKDAHNPQHLQRAGYTNVELCDKSTMPRSASGRRAHGGGDQGGKGAVCGLDTMKSTTSSTSTGSTTRYAMFNRLSTSLCNREAFIVGGSAHIQGSYTFCMHFVFMFSALWYLFVCQCCDRHTVTVLCESDCIAVCASFVLCNFFCLYYVIADSVICSVCSTDSVFCFSYCVDVFVTIGCAP